MTVYIYNIETREVVAKVYGENATQRALQENYDWDQYGVTEAPAFGANDGLIDTADAEIIEA